MLESFNTKNELQYHKLTPEEQSSRGILGRLVGVIADFKNPTRNGRRYTEAVWDKAFSDPLMLEKFENRCMLGELGHPTDRTEIDIEKVAICLAEKPKKGSDGKIYGVFDILNTPNGKILKTLCDYGCKIGVSSRGSGDTYDEMDGTESVEPGTFDCECWDAVLLPAVKAARPAYVTESLNTTHRKTLRESIEETLNDASDEDRRVMEATIGELNIYETEDDAVEDTENTIVEVEAVVDEETAETLKDKIYNIAVKAFDDCEKSIEECDTESIFDAVYNSILNILQPPAEQADDINTVADDTALAAEDNGADMVHELQESLKIQEQLEADKRALQQKLSVCYTKEARYVDALSRAKANLGDVQEQNKKLNEQLNSANELNSTSESTIETQKQQIKALKEQLDSRTVSHGALNENLSKQNAKIKSLEEQLTSVVAKNAKQTTALKEENKRLAESLDEAQKDAKIQKSQANAKLTKAQQLIEKYQSIAKTAVDKYIAVQARRIGVQPDEIKSKLNENYSFNDIDAACEKMQSYKLTVNKLPFNVTAHEKPVRMTIKESKEVISSQNDGVDDEIDTTLSNFL